jgi:peptidoglycan-N-acetylmuramic acid deacetylase
MKLKVVVSIGIISALIITMWVVLLSHLEGANNGEIALDSDLANASADCNWGLSFQVEGGSPIGNATSDYLQQYNAYYIDENSIDDKGIYLTFDAGYENGYTEKILDVLKEEGVTATFFLVGNYIEENPELVKRMVDEGHTVGNHTMHHPNMSEISTQEDFKKELEDLEAAYEKVIGEKMEKVYRPPQGKYSEENLKQASEMGYTTVFWSLAYVDWYENDQPTREKALNTLNSRIHPGAIVLLHSTSKTNSEILQELIQGWKTKGYVFKKLCGSLT